MVLVVDDEAAIRELLRVALEADGHEVAVADSVEAALELEQRGALDLVVSDLRMPGSSGLDGLDLLCALRERGVAAPFVLVTGSHESEYATRAAVLGTYAILAKPLALADLRRTIAAALASPRAA